MTQALHHPLVSDPKTQRFPLVLSLPHAGRLYPDGFLAQSQLRPEHLSRTEDRFVDLLLPDDLQGLGVRSIIGTVARTFVDVNRARDERDFHLEGGLAGARSSAQSSSKALYGFGVVPRKALAGREIYAGTLDRTEVDQRLLAVWDPYHQALQAAVDQTVARFGVCMILDLHTMPTITEAEIVLGTNQGRSVQPAITERAQRYWMDAGYRVSIDNPYAGGFITQHYGSMRSVVQCLQIECDRALYLETDQLTFSTGEKTHRLRKALAEFIVTLSTPDQRKLRQKKWAA